MPLAREITVADGVTLALDDWSEHAEGGADARPVLFLHATGFTRGVWRTHARRLLSDCVPYAADLRGAGGSSRPEPPYLWSLIVEDIVTLVEGEGWSDLVMVGHSVGGSTCVEVAERLPDVVSAVVLTEAPLSSPGPRREGASDLVEISEKRRGQWDSREQAAAYLRARSPYKAWDEEAWAGFVQTGFRDNAEGAELSCPGWVEASTFREAGDSQAWEKLARLQCPVWVHRGNGDTGMPSTTSPEVAERIPNARDIVVDGSGHFLPLERPELVAEIVQEALRATNGGAGGR